MGPIEPIFHTACNRISLSPLKQNKTPPWPLPKKTPAYPAGEMMYMGVEFPLFFLSLTGLWLFAHTRLSCETEAETLHLGFFFFLALTSSRNWITVRLRLGAHSLLRDFKVQSRFWFFEWCSCRRGSHGHCTQSIWSRQMPLYCPNSLVYISILVPAHA